MSVGKLGEFDVAAGNWSLYCDRLSMYFKANNISDELKLPTLISVVGEATYELMVNLVSPRNPCDLTYPEVIRVMKDHLQPKRSVMAESYRFRQREAETISQYVAELRKLSRFCDFTNSLNDNLRYQFVCGL